MKIWNSYGSEHSANLVMIGRFKDETSAERAKEVIEELADFMSSTGSADRDTERYSEPVYETLKRLGVHNLSPAELEQFNYGVRPALKGIHLTIRTDEPDLSAFLKLMVDHGARVEVYCQSDYPDSEKESES